MVLITEELLRKRAEHNEKEICTLEEVSLHQESITKIEHIDKWCRELKILLLQSNLISKIENLGRLKLLEYLNLALNNIEVIENLQGCEMLQKLDLTLNFIGDIESVRSLQHNEHLESLFMTGNPCADYPGYREFVIATLPQLKQLDGTQIFRSERITAVQKLDGIMEGLILHQRAHKEKRAKQKRELMSNTQTHNDNIDETDPEENSRYLDTSLIEIDVQPKYVRLTVKGKTLQLSLSEEVKTDDAVALRSQVTGFLTITMPKVNGEIKQKKEVLPLKPKNVENSNPSFSRREYLEIGRRDPVDYCNIVRNTSKAEEIKSQKSSLSKKAEQDSQSRKVPEEDFEDDEEVPPLE
ncbi:dynein axonemal assembly factor 11 isoform X2 [Bemisia tabaci]|uniref:dynein axonemal assembly factor 11 isoform X2 n=1 Tax=Bemisia tabaci TaxID=7038 RepID=UPI003B2892EC